ncbi:prolipoprotein diacylglyceryl transferase [Paenibacillus sp. FSL R7-0652]|uniref:prolipoprotein diacylglyceryl transferase n=1 Tax=Paenibacillus sp. FSL R7-0652 TaxID=2921687 RepID=UPI00315AC0F7
MKVILFEIGGYSIHSYGVIVALSVLLAYGAAVSFTKNTIYEEHMANSLFYALISALIGARIWHVFFFQWDYYSKHWQEIPLIWNGGISIIGAIIGGAVGIALYSSRKKLSFWGFADHLSPALVLGQALGRIACFLNGDAFGSPTNTGYGIVYPEGTMAYDQYGSQPLWPAEVWEGQWDLIIFTMLLIVRHWKLPTGVRFLSYCFLYAFGRFMLEYLRGDSPRYALQWTAGQWTSMIMMTSSFLLIGYFYCLFRYKRVDSIGTD